MKNDEERWGKMKNDKEQCRRMRIMNDVEEWYSKIQNDDQRKTTRAIRYQKKESKWKERDQRKRIKRGRWGESIIN